jgi:hypothetical protein
VEYDAQTRESPNRKASEAAVRLVSTARRETQLALERVARACGVAR